MLRCSIPTLGSCIQRVERKPDSFFPFFAEQKEFRPDMPERIEALIPICGMSVRAQLFLYIMWGVKTLKRMSTNPEAPFAFETPSDEEAGRLEAQIAGMPWDCQKIHGLLFDSPREFSYQHAWMLAAAMIRSFCTARHREFADRRLAFAMGGHSRLGQDSLVNQLHADTVRLIMEHLEEKPITGM